MPAMDRFSSLVGEYAIRMQSIQDLCRSATSTAALGILEMARFEWGSILLKRDFAKGVSTYHLVVRDKQNKKVMEGVVQRDVVASAIAMDVSSIASALLEDRALLDQILKTFFPTTIWTKLEKRLVSGVTNKATKKGRGPLRM